MLSTVKKSWYYEGHESLQKQNQVMKDDEEPRRFYRESNWQAHATRQTAVASTLIILHGF